MPAEVPRGVHDVLVDPPHVRELGVRKTRSLDSPPLPPREVVRHPSHELGTQVAERGQVLEKPRVDAGRLVQAFDGHPATQGRIEEERALGGRARDHAHQLVGRMRVVLTLGGIAVEPVAAGLERTERLLQALGERTPDRHHLTDRLHHGAEHRRRTRQLLEGPARHLGDDVVDRRLERRRRLPRDVVHDLVEPVADRDTRRDLGDRESGGLARQRTAARDARVHLDDHDVPVGRVHRELDVRPAGVDADATDAHEHFVAQPLVLDVREGLRGGHRDRVAGVDTHGVEVLDRTDDHHVVGVVAHDLELVFLPSRDRLFDQDLRHRARRQPVRRDPAHLLGVVGKPGATPAEDERRSHDDRVAHFLGHLHGFIEGVGEAGRGDGEPDLLHRGLELVTVLRGVDRIDTGADELDAVFGEHARLVQLDRQVERGLAAEGGEQRVGPLAFDDAGEALHVERFDVGRIGELGVGHDRGRVRVDQHDAVPLVAQDAARLRARVVELAGLADDDGPAADDENGLEVVAPRHYRDPPEARASVISAVKSSKR